MTTNLHKLSNSCNLKVLELFSRLLESAGEDKKIKVYALIDSYLEQGKSTERAMADSLFDFKLGGSV